MDFMYNNMITDNNSNFDGGYVLQRNNNSINVSNSSIYDNNDIELLPSDNIFISRANFRFALTRLIYKYTNLNNSAYITDKVLESVEYKEQLITKDYKSLAECIKIEVFRYTNVRIHINEIINICKQ